MGGVPPFQPDGGGADCGNQTEGQMGGGWGFAR